MKYMPTICISSPEKNNNIIYNITKRILLKELVIITLDQPLLPS